jgi:hypothetical protein
VFGWVEMQVQGGRGFEVGVGCASTHSTRCQESELNQWMDITTSLRLHTHA